MSARKKSTWFEVSVWDNFNGDCVRVVRKASEEELAILEERYTDDPLMSIVIDLTWEEDDDDDA